MSIKSFGERIADVLIEDGLLLPAPARGGDGAAEEAGRTAAEDPDGQAVRDRAGHGHLHGPLPRHAADQSFQGARAGRDPASSCQRTWRGTYKLSPVCQLGNKLFVAMADPLNVLALDDLRQRTKLEIVPMITTERERQRSAQRRRHGAARRWTRCCKEAAGGDSVEEVKADSARRSTSIGWRSSRRTRRSSRSSTSSWCRRSRKRRRTFTSSLSRSILKLRYRVDG